MRSRSLFLIAVFASLAATASAKNTVLVQRITRDLPLDPSGSLWVDNPMGRIEIVGVDSDHVTVTATATFVGVDDEAAKEARDSTRIIFEGDSTKVRLVRTVAPAYRTMRWSTEVNYAVRVPRTADVKVAGRAGDIQISDVTGRVTVKSFASNVALANVVGASAVDIVNGRVAANFPRRPTANVQIQIVGGDIDVVMPPEANFDWIADTLTGDILTTFQARGAFVGTAYHGHVNGTGGPIVNLQSLLGQVRLLAQGRPVSQALLMRSHPESGERTVPPPQKKIQLPIVMGALSFTEGNIADVSVGEVRGPAKILTAAGEIELGIVYGVCDVTTHGGPLTLGEMMGPLFARTGAGDILVRAAHEGGEIRTGGGVIRVLFTGGPTLLETGGGDIIVRQAAGPISAVTPSGDITITVDPSIRSQKMEARTSKGNIVLNLTPRFAADVDATVMTTDPDTNTIRFDFSTLTIRKEQVGGKSKIHVTGKVNGGGDRIELYAEEGDISITSKATPPGK